MNQTEVPRQRLPDPDRLHPHDLPHEMALLNGVLARLRYTIQALALCERFSRHTN